MSLYIPIQFCLLVGISSVCLSVLWWGTLRRREAAYAPFPDTGRTGGLRVPFGSSFDLWCCTAGVLLFLIGQLGMLRMGAEVEAQASSSLSGLAVSLLMQAAMYIPFIIRYVALPRMNGYADHGLLRRVLWAAAALALILIPAAAMEQLGLYEWLAKLTGCPMQQDVVSIMSNSGTAQRVLLVAAAVIMAPIGEEIFFRGFLYNLMRRFCGVWSAALLGGLFFGVMHGSLAQMLPLTLFGLVQCLAYEKARSLWLPISVHAVFNGFSSICIILWPLLEQNMPQ